MTKPLAYLVEFENGAQELWPASDGVPAFGETVTPLVAEREWMPIETAPKDGRSVLLWIPSSESWYYRNTICGRWVGEYQGWSIPGISGLLPTHWMSLPEPPK